MKADIRYLALLAALIPYLFFELRWLRRASAQNMPGWKSYLRRRMLAMAAMALAWILLTLSLAGIGRSARYIPERVREAEINVVVDVSNSMLARGSGITRLEASIDMIRKLTAAQTGLRWRLMAFKGAALTLSPASYDLFAFDAALNWLGPAVMDAPGSDIGRALAELGAGQAGVARLALVFSDGNDTGGQARAAAARLGAAGLRCVFVGVGGDEAGAVVDDTGAPVLDERGEPLVLYMNRKAMEEWARVAGADFIALDDPGSFAALSALLSETAGSLGRWKTRRVLTEHSPLVSLAALLALSCAMALGLPPRADRGKGRRPDA
jgi:Ca-activated chloride channel family protein